MSKCSDLIKVAQPEKLFGFVKGDVDGHPFRGNQHTDGEGGEGKVSLGTHKGGGENQNKWVKPQNASAAAEVNSKTHALIREGFAYDKTTETAGAANHILKHPDGSIATVTEHKDPVTERVKVIAYVNTTNQNKPGGHNALQALASRGARG